jgi:hypothetical protein
VAHPQIAAFARLARENTPPVRTIEGQKTQLSRTIHGFGYDPVHDEIVVTGALAQAILTFRGGASGEEPPLRVIQGPKAGIFGAGTGANDKVNVDGVHGEIYIISGKSSEPVNTLSVFDRLATGDVAPKRILRGVRGGTIAVDSDRDLLVVNGGGALTIYNRTASGDAKPIRVISGPRSQVAGGDTFMLYPPKGWIVSGCEAASEAPLALCVWSINDNGDVAPRFKLPVQQLTNGYQVSATALDPVHKEVIIVANGHKVQSVRPDIMNAIITFSWPEIF